MSKSTSAPQTVERLAVGQGRRAARKGVTRDMNPFVRDDEQYALWNEGFDEVKADTSKIGKYQEAVR